MNSYLLIWNPTNWDWTKIEEDILQLEKHGAYRDSWSCGVSKHTITFGDRVFLMRLGLEPKGIVASGFTTSSIYQDVHWDKSKDKLANYVNIDFDVILNPIKQDILSVDFLINNAPFNKYSGWLPRSSGKLINESIASELERLWFNFLNDKSYFSNRFDNSKISKYLSEGNSFEVKTKRYERNPYSRYLCLKKKGYNCSICGFNFEEKYGELGKDFIHVHHINPLSEVRKEHKLDPENDLIPICPNCHSMIHKKRPALKIEELIKIIES